MFLYVLHTDSLKSRFAFFIFSDRCLFWFSSSRSDSLSSMSFNANSFLASSFKDAGESAIVNISALLYVLPDVPYSFVICSTNFNVSLSGMVINKEDSSFILDDSTGQVMISNNQEVNGDFVRVFGRVNMIGEEIQIQGFIVQDLSKVDKFLYKKVQELIHG